MDKYEVWWELGKLTGCHQMPERSFRWKGKQFPICARCTGAFCGYTIGTFMLGVFRLPYWLCVGFALTMFIDWYIQHRSIRQSTNQRRFITGCLCGFGWIHFLANVVETLRKLCA